MDLTFSEDRLSGQLRGYPVDAHFHVDQISLAVLCARSPFTVQKRGSGASAKPLTLPKFEKPLWIQGEAHTLLALLSNSNRWLIQTLIDAGGHITNGQPILTYDSPLPDPTRLVAGLRTLTLLAETLDLERRSVIHRLKTNSQNDPEAHLRARCALLFAELSCDTAS